MAKNKTGNPNFITPPEQIDPLTQEKIIHLGCKYAKGRFPDLITKLHPNGLVFTGGRVTVLESELEELKDNHHWKKAYRGNTGGEIFRITQGRLGATTDQPQVINTGIIDQGAAEEIQTNAIVDANESPESNEAQA
jgi:hypothetical protein